MSITSEQKGQVIRDYQLSQNDTGSVEVQCAIVTTRINNLIEHFKAHKKDNHSKRGLLKMVSKRRKMLKYIKNDSVERYLTLIKRLNIRR